VTKEKRKGKREKRKRGANEQLAKEEAERIILTLFFATCYFQFVLVPAP